MSSTSAANISVEAIEKACPKNYHLSDAKGPPGELAGLSCMSGFVGIAGKQAANDKKTFRDKK